VTLTWSAAANTLIGGSGADRIEGGLGRNQMTGGGAADTFIFRAVADSSPTAALRDVITDFTPGTDKLDLSIIDANMSTGRNDTFGWGGQTTAALQQVKANSVTWYQDTANNRTVVLIDNTGDAQVDMQIELSGLKTLGTSDFIL
jgi:Ca2+-binding RTX toxin-like protein